MNVRHITAALLALLVLGAGAAAATPGAAPDEVSAEDQSGDAGPSVDVGPPSDLPGPVPEFVGDIHDAVGGFLDGPIESLGDAVSGVTPDGDDRPSPAENGGSGDAADA